MPTRSAAVAGQFYDAAPGACRTQIEQMLPGAPLDVDLPPKILAGVVPHAGWVFSGSLAAMVFAAIKQQNDAVDTFVIFGAVHAVRTKNSLLYDSGSWQTPLGPIDIDQSLAADILAQIPNLVHPDCNAHNREHSIEVQVPIIQYLFPDAQILPLLVPPTDLAGQIGAQIAPILKNSQKTVVCIGSTDLTHYGPSYFFTPHATDPQALQWAQDTNDRYFIDLALALQADRLVDAAQTYSNACGAGAAAAAIAAAQQLGATRGCLLAHTTSAEILQQKFHQSATDSVGYAAIVFG